MTATVPSASFLAPVADAPHLDVAHDAQLAPGAQNVVYCRHCGGSAPGRHGAPPHGWYALSVSVPTEVRTRGLLWVGLFCQASCLAGHGPEIAAAEARATYQRVPAEGGAQ